MEAGEAVCLAGVASSLDVEVRALKLAVGMACQTPGAGRVVICTDSRSALEALRLPTDGERTDISGLRKEVLRSPREISFQWVPGHCGLPGNEVANRVVKAAAGLKVSDGTAGLIAMNDDDVEAFSGDLLYSFVGRPVDCWDSAW